MQRQGSFSQAEYAGKKKQTRRDKFLAEMEQVVPWARLIDRLQPLYPKGERGRPPIGLERMLRIYFLQQWYGLADAALEDALYDSQALGGLLAGLGGLGFCGLRITPGAAIARRRRWSGATAQSTGYACRASIRRPASPRCWAGPIMAAG